MTEKEIDKAMTGYINLDSLVCHSCSNVQEYRDYKEQLHYIYKAILEARERLKEEKSGSNRHENFKK